MHNKRTVIEMRNITKVFPGVRALDNVSFYVKERQIHALVGENGAGKSTLAKILAGIQSQDHGDILLDGKKIEIHNSRSAQKMGIGMVFQEISLIPTLSVAQNLLLAHEPELFNIIVNKKRLLSEANIYLSKVGLKIDPNRKLQDLGIAEQQLVALARALSFQPRILILDETTSSLTSKETNHLFSILKTFKSNGGSVIYISHRLNEIFEIADHITVLKDGLLIDSDSVEKFTIDLLVQKMVGQKIKKSVRKNVSINNEVLRINNLSLRGLFNDVNMFLNEGEIVGIAGLVGSGRTEIAEAIFGIRSFDTGNIEIYGKSQRKVNPIFSIKNRMGFIPENRHLHGLCLGLSIQKNIIMASLKRLFPKGFIFPKQEKETTQRFIEKFSISSQSKSQPVRFLSGGNQQKVVMAKWLCSESKIFIFDEPTRGIDVKSKSEIHQLINQLTISGAGILLISSELPEIISLCDRVYVMKEGRIVAECCSNDIQERNILNYMLGANNEA